LLSSFQRARLLAAVSALARSEGPVQLSIEDLSMSTTDHRANCKIR
jgi:hypothetical protein